MENPDDSEMSEVVVVSTREDHPRKGRRYNTRSTAKASEPELDASKELRNQTTTDDLEDQEDTELSIREIQETQKELLHQMEKLKRENENLQRKLLASQTSNTQTIDPLDCNTVWQDLYPTITSTPRNTTNTNQLPNQNESATSITDQGILRTLKSVLPMVGQFTGKKGTSLDEVNNEFQRYVTKVESAIQMSGYDTINNLDERGEMLLWAILNATCAEEAFARLIPLKNIRKDRRGTQALITLSDAYQDKPSAQTFLRTQQQLCNIKKDKAETLATYELRFRTKLQQLQRIAAATNLKAPDEPTLSAMIKNGVKHDKRFAGVTAIFLHPTIEQDSEEQLDNTFKLLYRWEAENELASTGDHDESEIQELPTSTSFQSTETDTRRRDLSRVSCYNCDKKGHLARHCKAPRRRDLQEKLKKVRIQRLQSRLQRLQEPRSNSGHDKRVTWSDHQQSKPSGGTSQMETAAMMAQLRGQFQQMMQEAVSQLATTAANEEMEEDSPSFVGMIAHEVQEEDTEGAVHDRIGSSGILALNAQQPILHAGGPKVILDNGSGKHYVGTNVPLAKEHEVEQRISVETAGGTIVCNKAGYLDIYMTDSSGKYTRVRFLAHRLPTLRKFVLLSEHLLDELEGSTVEKLRKNGRVVAQKWSYNGLDFVMPKNHRQRYFGVEGTVQQPRDIAGYEIQSVMAVNMQRDTTSNHDNMCYTTQHDIKPFMKQESMTTPPRDTSIAKQPSDAVKTLDAKLGFPNTKVLRKTLKNLQEEGLYPKLSVENQVKRTEAYLASRQRLRPVHKHKHPVLTTTLMKRYAPPTVNRFRIISSDMFEPNVSNKNNGTKVMLIFLDNLSGYASATALRNKSATSVAQAFEKFLINMATAPKTRIVYHAGQTLFYSDNAAAYRSEKFKRLLASKGFMNAYASPGRHSTNSIVERRIQTSTVVARGLLMYADLSVQLWDFAFAWAIFLTNLWMSGEDASPYEKLAGEKPTKLIEKMLPFGQRVRFIKLGKQQHYSKLQARGDHGVIVGYSQQARSHMVYDHKTKRTSLTNEIVIIPDPHKKDNDIWSTIPRLEPQKRAQYLAYLTHDEQLDSETADITSIIVDHCDRLDSLIYANDQRNTSTPQQGHDEGDGDGDIAFLIVGQMSYHQVLKMPPGVDRDGLLCAYSDELQQLQRQGTWKVVSSNEIPNLDKSKILRPVTCLGAKYDAQGRLVRYKGRVCVDGSKQIADSQDSYAPTATMWTVKLMFGLIAAFGFHYGCWDVKNAYLNAEVPRSEQILMYPPPGLVARMHKDGGRNLLLIRKALYGLKQSAAAWNRLLTETLEQLSFKRLLSDTSMYLLKKDTGEGKQAFVVVILFVDDGLTVSNHEETMEWFYAQLSNKFKMTITRKPTSFLGLKITESEDSIALDQGAYAERMLEAHGMDKSNSAPTPMITKRPTPEDLANHWTKCRRQHTPQSSERYDTYCTQNRASTMR